MGTSPDVCRLWMGLLDHLSADHSETLANALEALQLGLRLARLQTRPRWHALDRLKVKTIRLLVQIGQKCV